jgi:hypothetical protein
MRILAAAVLGTLLSIAASQANEIDLLNKFRQQNERSRTKLADEIKLVLDKADELEKDDPLAALAVLQDARDRLLEKHLLAGREDRTVADPLWERIQSVRSAARSQFTDALQTGLSEFREYRLRMKDQLATVRTELVPPHKAAPPGEPAYFALANGKVQVGWLNERPDFVVDATVNDQQHTLGAGLVTGIQTAEGFYRYQPASKRMVWTTPAELFTMAIASYAPARKPGFWLTLHPDPPTGFFKNSMGVLGAGMFARGVAPLLTTWAHPTGKTPEAAVAESGTVSVRRVYRDAIVDLHVQKAFASLKRREDQVRFRNLIINFLDQREQDGPLSTEEIGRLAEVIADVAPDRRTEAIAFAYLLNGFYEDHLRKLKK